ncbi:MAG: CBS domain-containing protein [Halobacteriovoraceae bacterium]|jgi:CBS domain-containing membrane protein|nr:CBS domain-containing protein [Halobacteriovoraceae bacterium]
MSFIVSFNGQFSPYKLPDLSKYDRVKHVFKAQDSHAIDNNHADAVSLEKSFAQSSKGRGHAKKHGIDSYQQGDKEFYVKSIPHFARDLMTANPKVLRSHHSYEDAVLIMGKHHFRHLPVLDEEGTLVGIVSERDLINIQGNPKITALMTNEVLTCFEVTRIQDISKIMVHEKLSALPVINDKYQMIGIVTQSDILNFVTTIMSVNFLF